MARIRTIKPETWVDEKFTELTFPSRLLFIGLWNFCDREGRMVYSPRKLKSQIFPADSIDVVPLIDELTTLGMVFIYQTSNERILEVPSFKKHQLINTREPQSLLPTSATAEVITGSGYVYLVLCREVGRFKVGFSRSDPQFRLKTLETGSALDLELVDQVPGDSKYENAIHIALKEYRVKNEWFTLSKESLEILSNFFSNAQAMLEQCLSNARSVQKSEEGKGREGNGNTYVESKSDSTLLLVPPSEPPAIAPIWDYFVEKLGKSSVYEFSEKRKTMGKRCYEWALKRTRDPSKAEDWMRIAVDELARSDYHMGRGKYQGQARYCDWENIFKSVDKFQWWLERNNEKCQ